MSLCSRCGAAFGCAMTGAGNGEHCWCTLLPAVVAVPPVRDDAQQVTQAQQPVSGQDSACWCPACLQCHIDTVSAPPAPSLADAASLLPPA